MSSQDEIEFLFESGEDQRYVGVLANSELVSGPVASQNAGSTNAGIYYQVGGGGLNQRFHDALGDQVDTVNADLRGAYDANFGAGHYAADSVSPPTPPLLKSLIVPLKPGPHVGDRVVAQVYSVGPRLTTTGLTSSLVPLYTELYRDAMNRLASWPTRIDAMRITMLSSGLYRGGAPIAAFCDAAASCIITGIRAAVRNQYDALGGVAILINTDRTADFPMELNGFGNAATAMGAKVTTRGFTIPVT